MKRKQQLPNARSKSASGGSSRGSSFPVAVETNMKDKQEQASVSQDSSKRGSRSSPSPDDQIKKQEEVSNTTPQESPSVTLRNSPSPVNVVTDLKKGKQESSKKVSSSSQASRRSTSPKRQQRRAYRPLEHRKPVAFGVLPPLMLSPCRRATLENRKGITSYGRRRPFACVHGEVEDVDLTEAGTGVLVPLDDLLRKILMWRMNKRQRR